VSRRSGKWLKLRLLHRTRLSPFPSCFPPFFAKHGLALLDLAALSLAECVWHLRPFSKPFRLVPSGMTVIEGSGTTMQEAPWAPKGRQLPSKSTCLLRLGPAHPGVLEAGSPALCP
jgi:hypothetical protein